MAQAETVEDFLKAQKASVARPLRLAVGTSLGNGLLIIAQAWLVATIITAVLFEKAHLTDVFYPLIALPPIFALRAALIIVSEEAAVLAATEVKSRLRDTLLRHVITLGPVRLAAIPAGTIATTLTDNIDAVQPYYARYLPALTLTSVLPLAIFLAVLPSDWISGLVFLLTAPLIPLFMVLIGRSAEKMNQRQWAGLARMSGHLLDAIQGLPTLKLFNASRREAKLVSAMAENYRRDTMEVLRVAFLSSLALEFFATVSIAMVAVFIGFRLLWGEIGFFQGFFVLLLAPEFYAPLRALGTHYHARMEAIGAAEKIIEVVNLPVTKPADGTRSIPLKKPPEIVFDNVTVTFDDGRRGLAGLSFKVAPGERVALVGPSGAGKSTVFSLLLGFLVPTSGQILIDGEPVDEISAEWRAAIAWLPQRPHLFRASVLDNIAMTATPLTDGVRSRVAEAAAKSCAAERIAKLPEGYDTLLAEAGSGLSGGEAQRIALARAFYRRPSLVLLDEPTAHLDISTEASIADATDTLLTGPSSITIAHRLETVRRADRIVVIDHGKLIEQGTHAALIRTGGTYAKLAAAVSQHAVGDAP